jgi:putative membrane protein insertion efficiency factor
MKSVPLVTRRLEGRHLLRPIAALPKNVLVLLIRVYQRTVSPLLPVVTLGTCGCRFSPTCSHYAAEAIRTHGALAGLGLALARLIKCTPRHPGGVDPVPPVALYRPPAVPVCHAIRRG